MEWLAWVITLVFDLFSVMDHGCLGVGLVEMKVVGYWADIMVVWLDLH